MLNFFKKKKSDESISLFKEVLDTNIMDIWKIEDKNSFIIAMNSWICKKCNYGADIDKLSHQERVFYITQEFEVEVNNGGISQFFYNTSGNFANEMVDSFTLIGAEKTANICKKAIGVFGCKLPVNRDERDEFINQMMTNDVNEVLNECDTMFYEYLDNLKELNYQFVNKNRDFFN